MDLWLRPCTLGLWAKSFIFEQAFLWYWAYVIFSRLRALLEAKEEKNKEKTPASPVSDNYLIISLQHQLESERLNSRNLKHQVRKD